MTTRTTPPHPRSTLASGDFWGGIRSGPLLPVLLGALIIAAVITYVLRDEGRAARTKPAPYAYLNTPYQATRATLCPGDTLAYTVTLEIRNPSSMLIIKTIGTRSGYNIPTWEMTRRAIYDQPTAPGQPIIIPERITVPELPPGQYHLLETRQLPDATQEFYRVSFDVPGGCS